MADIDLILKELTDPHVKENFNRVRRFISGQVILDGNWQFFEVDIAAASPNFAIRHRLSFVPIDIIILGARGDQNYSLDPATFDATNIYVSADGPVVLRFLAGRYSSTPRTSINYPYVATSGAGPAGPAGPPGPAGPSSPELLYRISASALSALRAVKSDADGRISLGTPSSTFEDANVFGITTTAVGAADLTIEIATGGTITDAFFSTFTLNDLIFLGASGTLTQVAPVSGMHVVLGKYIGNNQILVEVEQPVIL